MARPQAVRDVIASTAALDQGLVVMRIKKLRAAVQDNKVSFPAQIPVFPRLAGPELQKKVVQLYFIHGWDSGKIRSRYRLGRSRLFQILSAWKNCAVEQGYIQVIPSVPDRESAAKASPLCISLRRVAAVRHQVEMPASSSVRAAKANVDDHCFENTIYRPRRSCKSIEISAILGQLQAGESVAELASRVGVSASTIYSWKREHDWQCETAELKERLARLEEHVGIGAHEN